MNQVIRAFVIATLFFSFITLSCKKEILSDDQSVISSQQNDVLAHDNLSNEVILEWSNVAFEASGGALEGHPLLASRIKAMMHIAMHDALNAIAPVYKYYTYHAQQCNLADPFAAAVSAAHTVLKASWPDSASMLDARLAVSLANIPDGPAKTKGIELGIASGNAILALRANDHAYDYPLTYVPVSTVPGVYNAVPPDDSMYGVAWAKMQLFSLQTQSQFRSPLPPPLNSAVYARDYNEVKHYGKINSSVRSADQTAYAIFWYELSDIGWNRIAQIQAADHNTGLYATARMFALLNMALADSYTSCWESKYHYYTWRPYTAIRAATTDGNPYTTPNQNWEPLLTTPPIPEYPSGHCTLANAAATVLTYFFGNDSPFSTTSTTAVGTERSFKNFKQAADENADSRVMVGIHFRFACNAGQKMGNNVGKWTVDNYLKPLH